jgi:prephenate dehydrogenase
MRVAFLGLGLIGGSVARALRADPGAAGWELAAWTPSGRGPSQALAASVVDAACDRPADALRDATLVVLAAPPLACVELVGRLGEELREALAPGATVTDVASTKAALTAAAADAGIPFVGGHPMAGRETSGFDAGVADLFRGRPWVITDAVGGGDPDAVRALATACGAVPVALDAERHDRLAAAISHLPLLTSVLLAETVTGAPGPAAADWADAAALAASGWRDTTRLARGDTAMGAQILATNAPRVAALLRAYRDGIDAWLALLEGPAGPDTRAIEDRLAASRARLGEGR